MAKKRKTYTPEISERDMADFYKSGGRQDSGTVVTGFGCADRPSESGVGTSMNVPSPQRNSKPVLGFLYSVSNNGKTEFWPLHLGTNILGSHSSRDVFLPEATVSSRHASLVIQKMKNPEKVVAAISDMGSTNGTMLNGESVFITPRECKSGDKITAGDHYELLLILLDPKQLNLEPVDDFIPLSRGSDEGPEPEFPGGDGDQFPDDGTVDVNGGDGFGSGGTVGL